jgi:large subunit ribosomal protein LP2
MKYLAAYCLCVLGGNATPSADDLKGVFAEVGIEADEA